MNALHYTVYNYLHVLIVRDEGWHDEFKRYVKEYYEEYPTGGSLHIVLDDGNIEDEDIWFSKGYASGSGDEIGAQLASLMAVMTKEQRKLVTNFKEQK